MISIQKPQHLEVMELVDKQTGMEDIKSFLRSTLADRWRAVDCDTFLQRLKCKLSLDYVLRVFGIRVPIVWFLTYFFEEVVLLDSCCQFNPAPEVFGPKMKRYENLIPRTALLCLYRLVTCTKPFMPPLKRNLYWIVRKGKHENFDYYSD